MGCSESKPEAKTTTDRKIDHPGKEPVLKSENGSNVPAVGSVAVKKQNGTSGAVLNGDTNINSPEDSFETLVIRKEKPCSSSNSRRGSHGRGKPKELSQVQPAWGKKTTTSDNNFLEDLRLLRDTTGKNTHYEQDYETVGVDDASMFIERTGSEHFVESSHNVFNNLASPNAQPRSGAHEEGFDASKIIDVEKFRAANVTEKKQTSPSGDNRNNVGSSVQIKPSYENHQLHSSLQDISATENDESFIGLYNEDDKDLIESIEQEFSHDNYHLPGQIIN